MERPPPSSSTSPRPSRRRGDAFAPAAISNFFAIHDEGLSDNPPSLSRVGATGGGYMLSSGAHTVATVEEREVGRAGAAAAFDIKVVVNGDPNYVAETTRTAVELLLSDAGSPRWAVLLEQQVGVPIGHGFGASAASALSAAIAVSRALGLRLSSEAVAYYAHAADIICRTGLGTVSAIYSHGGAAVIVRPGAPGVAEVRQVTAPAEVSIVTASLAPRRKDLVLSSPEMRLRVNELGREALLRASDLSLTSLVEAGERFSQQLGLETPELRHLLAVAKDAGAMGASQNMVGHAVHALVWDDDVAAVASALERDGLSPVVGVYKLAASPSHARRVGEGGGVDDDERPSP